MKKLILIIAIAISIGCTYSTSNTYLTPVRLSKEEIEYLKKDLQVKDKAYDKTAKMLSTVTGGRHYHSDLDSGVVVHQTRESLEYAVALLKTEDDKYMRRGLDIVKTVLPMQEKDSSLPYCGIWPYYPEDPLRGREAAVDHNWADFIAVPLIDVIINHSEYTGQELVKEIKDALILAARAIKKRDVQPDYTNICIMGAYVCYIVGDICNEPGLTDYARKRLTSFYNYTIRNKGFTEYNSPAYTLVAMDELLRMQQTIINPNDRKMIDELYAMSWDMIARHFHQPSGQWCGPNLRAYSSTAEPKFYRLLYNASDSVIELPGEYPRIPNVITPHKIPKDILPKFTNSLLPRLEIDTFVVANPEVKIERTNVQNNAMTNDIISAKDIIGKLYATPDFALASVNQGYMWNQTRPLIAHWGTPEKPSYLQVRFLHDDYDFSAVNIFCTQDTTTVLAIFNIASDGGDKHPSLDPIQNATFNAYDLRLRFEVGGDLTDTDFTLSEKSDDKVYFSSRNINAIIEIPYAQWDNLTGYWEIGKDATKLWADYVIYSGKNRVFNLNNIKETVIGTCLSMSADSNDIINLPLKINKDASYLTLINKNMKTKALLKPSNELRLKNDYESENFEYTNKNLTLQ